MLDPAVNILHHLVGMQCKKYTTILEPITNINACIMHIFRKMFTEWAIYLCIVFERPTHIKLYSARKDTNLDGKFSKNVPLWQEEKERKKEANGDV